MMRALLHSSIACISQIKMNTKYHRWLNTLIVTLSTLLVITVPLILFCVSQMQYMTEQLGYGLPIAIITTYALMIGQFFLVSASNPGILKRQYFPANAYDVLTSTYRKVAPPRFLEINVYGQVIRTKYCVTCHIYRPPRTVHCSSCGGCVLRYDHHCPYVSNCIGINNYKKFASFVTTCCIYFLMVVVAGIYRLVGFFPHIGDSVDEDPISTACTIISIAVSLLILWLVLGLCCFHVLIISKGQSTYDRIKGNFMDFNPFYRGCKRSVCEFLCRNVKSVGFVKPWRRRHQVKSIYHPGAMFESQQQREEVLKQNSVFDDEDDDDGAVGIMSNHDRNTLKYVKAFGQNDLLTQSSGKVKHTLSSSHIGGGSAALFAESPNRPI